MTRLHSVTLVNRGDRTAGVREDQSILEAFESLGEALPAGCRYGAFWSIANARRVIGYEPEDDSEQLFADDIHRYLSAPGRTF